MCMCTWMCVHLSFLFNKQTAWGKLYANIKLLKYAFYNNKWGAMYNMCQFTINAFQNHFSKQTWVKNKLFLLGWIPLWSGRSSRVHTAVLILGFLFWRLQDLQKIYMAPLFYHIIKALSINFIPQNTKFQQEVLWKKKLQLLSFTCFRLLQ